MPGGTQVEHDAAAREFGGMIEGCRRQTDALMAIGIAA